VGVAVGVTVTVALGVAVTSCRHCRSWRWAKESVSA
jgi:hypothetical protein